MKIVCMSDSHCRDNNVTKILEENQDADFFLHCGDLCSESRKFPNVIFVKGNNDYEDRMPMERILDFNGLKIYMTHSHNISSYSRNQRLAQLAKKNDCQLVLFGHTHCVVDEEINGVRLLNPGSLFYNRDYTNCGYYVIDVDIDGTYSVHFVEI